MNITTHHLPGCDKSLTITVEDEPGPGGAPYYYTISGFDTAHNAASGGTGGHRVGILFQNGPVAEHGVNGITDEALIAILIHRMRGFQGGQCACRENEIALNHLTKALIALHSRTVDRLLRDVYGTTQP